MCMCVQRACMVVCVRVCFPLIAKKKKLPKKPQACPIHCRLLSSPSLYTDIGIKEILHA